MTDGESPSKGRTRTVAAARGVEPPYAPLSARRSRGGGRFSGGGGGVGSCCEQAVRGMFWQGNRMSNNPRVLARVAFTCATAGASELGGAQLILAGAGLRGRVLSEFFQTVDGQVREFRD